MMQMLTTQSHGTEVFDAVGISCTSILKYVAKEHKICTHPHILKIYWLAEPLFKGHGIFDPYGPSVTEHFSVVIFDEREQKGYKLGSQGLCRLSLTTPGQHNITATVINTLPAGCHYQGNTRMSLIGFAVNAILIVRGRQYEFGGFNCQKLVEEIINDMFDKEVQITQSVGCIVSGFVKSKIPLIAARFLRGMTGLADAEQKHAKRQKRCTENSESS